MEAKMFNTIIILYLLTTFAGITILFMPCMVERVHAFKKWLASKVNHNYALYVIAISTLFMIYGVVFAGLVTILSMVSIVVWAFCFLIVTFIKTLFKMPQAEDTNNIVGIMPVVEEV